MCKGRSDNYILSIGMEEHDTFLLLEEEKEKEKEGKEEKEGKKRGLIKGTVTAKVLSFQKRREKEDRIAESQPFRERTNKPSA
jgi:hypothetical protein